MQYFLFITDDAQNDMQKAYDYIETEQSGLGDKLIQKIENALTSIISNPQLYAKKYRESRQIRVKPFRYLILHLIDKEKIIFFSLFHGNQHPGRKIERIRNQK